MLTTLNHYEQFSANSYLCEYFSWLNLVKYNLVE